MATVDTSVLKRFPGWHGVVPPGFFVYFLGNLTRPEFCCLSTRLPHSEGYQSFPAGPPIDADLLDWLPLLEAVVEARDEFVMVSLGSGWGRWLVAGAMAAKQFKGLPCQLVGVEAEPTHFKWMLTHFEDNCIDSRNHRLIQAAVTEKGGEDRWFYCGKPESWYGQSLIHDLGLDLATEGESGTIQYGNERATRVRAVDLWQVTYCYQRIDYLQMDVQGEELRVLAAHPQVLSKVRRINIGTHTAEIEAGLRELFKGLGWICQYDFPLWSRPVVAGMEIALEDGVQIWLNPTLVVEI